MFKFVIHKAIKKSTFYIKFCRVLSKFLILIEMSELFRTNEIN